jgi:RNA polymerase sigma-70 factor (ECF subfamily)
LLDGLKKVVRPRDPHRLVLDDSALLMRAQRGDEQAMALLHDRYSKLVYSVALRVLRDPAAAEDVLQDIFMKIWISSGGLEVAGGIFPQWMAVVARNRSIDVLRRRRPADTLEGLILASSYNLANHAEQNLMCEKARVLIAELPGEQRKVLEMAFFDGMSHSEIAAMTGRPLGTIKSSIRNALSTLRKGFRSDDAGRVNVFLTAIREDLASATLEVAPELKRPRA